MTIRFAGDRTNCVMLTNLHRAHPDICERDVAPESEWPAGQPMCFHHIGRFEAWALRLTAAVHAENVARDRRRERELAESRSVVYFLQRESGDIKIGYSTYFSSRRSSLTREHGPLDTLALIRGGRDLEHQHHQRFAVDRIGRSEWFRPSASLLAYIASIANDDQAVAS